MKFEFICSSKDQMSQGFDHEAIYYVILYYTLDFSSYLCRQ